MLWTVAVISITIAEGYRITEYAIDTRSLSHSDFPANWVEDQSVTLTVEEIEDIAREIKVTTPIWMFWKDTATQGEISFFSGTILIFLVFLVVINTLFLDEYLQARCRVLEKYKV